MTKKTSSREREAFHTSEDDQVVVHVPSRTVYIHRGAGNAARFVVGVRHRRAKAYWAEAKASKASIDEALKSAEVWRVRAEKEYLHAYKTVVCPRAVLSRIFAEGRLSEFSMLVVDYKVATETALQRRRAFVPPPILYAAEALAASGEENCCRLALDFLGWTAGRPPGPTFEQMLEVLPAAAVELDDAEDADGEAGEEKAGHDG